MQTHDGAMTPRDGMYDRQPQAAASGVTPAHVRSAATTKALEDTAAVSHRDTGPVVHYTQNRPALFDGRNNIDAAANR